MSRLRIASIVEGDGEVLALPILLRRIWSELLGGEHVEVLRPNRCKRDRLVNASYNELARFVELAVQQLSAKRDETPELILILVDAEDDLACQLGPSLLKRSQACRPDLEIRCVIANHCYETWFAAAADSLMTCGRLKSDAPVVSNPEDADLRKSWVKQHINRAKYSETADQPGLTAAMDLAQCREKSPSFDKLCRELEARLHTTPMDEGPSGSD
jgi:hypothetical protein